MELIGAGPGNDVDDSTRGASGLRCVAVGLDRDLLNAFDVGLDADGADDAFVVVDTIDHPVIEA